MFLPEQVSNAFVAHTAEGWANQTEALLSSVVSPILGSNTDTVPRTQVTHDPQMDGKLAILSEFLPPDLGVALGTFGAANDAAGGALDQGLGRLGGCFSNGPELLQSGLAALSGGSPVQALAAFLPPEAQLAVSAAQSLLQGDPIGAVMSVLPPEAKAAAAVAMPLLSGDLAGSLNALAGRFIPPELMPVLSSLEKSGLLEGPFQMARSAIPNPFAKPKAPEPGSADLSTDPGADCGVAPMAARISDLVSCPKGGGPIFTGQMNVLIGFMPAARKTDKSICVGPPDMINDGEPTVRIGGMDASRLGDATAHGGNIVSGFSTVLIGKSHAPCMKAAAARRAAFVINGPPAV